ncbi:MAG TPA: hypothetical protein PK902_08915 [Actinomycetota bacterium]|nr:hypothetical protein [Actinomycetota bacterium]
MESTITPIGKGEVLLHVGLHKTGTTALQVALADARGVLEDHGVRYPGKGLYHHKAILAGADRPYGWRENGARITPKKHWKKMLKEADYSGRTIISSEFLDDISPEICARVVDDLGGPERVSVVVTLRSIGAILPSAWQQGLKAGVTTAYNSWLKVMFDEDQSPRAERFWFRHDQVEQVKRWADIVGADRTYVVVIPDGDRTAIFTAFEGLLDLPQGFLAGREQIIQNRSMTTPEAEFVRRLNKELAGQMSWDEYTVMVRRAMILNMVEKRRPAADEPRIQTPQWAADKAEEYGQRFAKGIAELGVQVIGDPADLALRPRSGDLDRPDVVSIDAAVAGTAGLVLEALAERRALEEKVKAAAVEPPAPTRRSRWTARGAARALKRGFSK